MQCGSLSLAVEKQCVRAVHMYEQFFVTPFSLAFYLQSTNFQDEEPLLTE